MQNVGSLCSFLYKKYCICIVRILLISLSPNLYIETFCTWMSIFLIVYFLAVSPCQNAVNCLGLFSFPVPPTPTTISVQMYQKLTELSKGSVRASQHKPRCQGLKWRAVSPVALRRQENRGEDMDTVGQSNTCEDMGGVC